MTHYYDSQRLRLDILPLTGLARPSNNSSKLSRIKIFNESQKVRSIFDAAETPERFETCFVYIHYASTQPHWHDESAGVPHILYGRSTLGVSHV